MTTLKQKQGFTLIEVIVAVGILAMLLVVISGIIARYFAAERISIAQQNLQEDTRFAVESMAREIRTAYGDSFVLPDSTGQALTMVNQNGTCVEYHLNTDTKQIERAEGGAATSDICSPDNFASQSFVAITSPQTIVQELTFTPTRSNPSPQGYPDKQGFVVINITAAPKTDSQLAIQLETVAASRQVILFTP
jgi:prepilin-type N-terminal cleavage/methylation domain-containing protein